MNLSIPTTVGTSPRSKKDAPSSFKKFKAASTFPIHQYADNVGKFFDQRAPLETVKAMSFLHSRGNSSCFGVFGQIGRALR